MKLYVGNLAWGVSDTELRQAFEKFGDVESASVVLDRETGRSRGFGFVEMANAEGAKAAVSGLDGQDIAGRPVRVSQAHNQ